MSNFRELTPAELAAWMKEGNVELIDVRETIEHEAEHIPGSQLAPLSRLHLEPPPRPQGKKAVLYCRSGVRSVQAARVLMARGWPEVAHLQGGILRWKQEGGKVEAAQGGPGVLRRLFESSRR